MKGKTEVENSPWQFVEHLEVNRKGPSVPVIGTLERKRALGSEKGKTMKSGVL